MAVHGKSGHFIFFLRSDPLREIWPEQFPNVAALCAEVFRPSIGVPVHRGGNPVQKFLPLVKKTFFDAPEKQKQIPRFARDDMLMGPRGAQC
jgi:hypothetical protein